MQPLSELTRSTSALPKGTAFSRYAMALARGRGSLLDAQLHAEFYRDTPVVAHVIRSAVAAGSTTGDWGSDLSYQAMAQEFVDLLRPATIIGRIANLRSVPFNARMGKATSGASAYWVGQGAVKPVSAMTVDAITLDFAKIAAIVVLTSELMAMSSPSAEAVVRRELIAALAAFADVSFIDPTRAATPGVSPASITNGATAITSTGGSVAQIIADVEDLFEVGIAAGVSYATGVWVMNPRTALYLSRVLTTGGAPMWPTINIRGGQWYGLPVVTSGNVPVESGGDTSITLLDAQEVFLAEGTVTLDVSRQGAIEMDDAPRGGAQQLTSLWQHNLVALRAEQFLNWGRRNNAGVAYLDDVSF